MRQLRLLSYNIQVGVETRYYRHYLTRSWRHLLPHPERLQNLNRIAAMAACYDLVGLQEVDSGSLRSSFVDQTQYLARQAGFPYWYAQINRHLGHFAKHSNGFLSHLRPKAIHEHKLPGLPGRGAIVVEFGRAEANLAVAIVHLALGPRSQRQQLAYLSEVLNQYPHCILMGDFNCGCDSNALRSLIRSTNLHEPACETKTFPSWRPKRLLDHILVSTSLVVKHVRVLNYALSDHLPVEMELQLPIDLIDQK